MLKPTATIASRMWSSLSHGYRSIVWARLLLSGRRHLDRCSAGQDPLGAICALRYHGVPMETPLLTVTPDARAKIDSVRTFNDLADALLRLRVVGKEGPRFLYEIALEDPQEQTDADLALDLDGLTVVVDARTATDVAGATIDLDPSIMGGGLRVDNPNEGWQEPLARAVQDVLD